MSYPTPQYRAFAPDPIGWASELRTAGVVTAFVAMAGSVLGLVWHALGPHIDAIAAVGTGSLSTAALKPLIGDDVWLGLLGAAAGVVCVAVLVLVAPEASRGPGAMVGLAVGGFVAMLVAARVGHQVGQRDLVADLKAGIPGISPEGIKVVLSYVDFSVRAKGVLLSWPLASVLVNAVIVFLRSVNEPPRTSLSTYPGSS